MGLVVAEEGAGVHDVRAKLRISEWVEKGVFLKKIKTHYVHVRLWGLWYAVSKAETDSRAGQVNLAPTQF